MSRAVRNVARAALAATAPALLLFAYSTGPDPRYTAAPGDAPEACAAGCHVGTAVNGGGGKVVVTFAGGQVYAPGVPQTFTIVITDPNAAVYGFQMTARLASNPASGQAGDFTAGPQQFVICEDGSFKTAGRNCLANAPVQFIEHSQPFKTGTISVQWTPPASNVGDVHIYVAANAANNDGNLTGDHIYTADYVLSPAAEVVPPTLSAVNSAAAFSPDAGLASGTWLEIYGSNLSTTTRAWAAGDFNGTQAPTALDGVSVTVGGVPAFVGYISPGQVNIQAPDDSSTGAGVQVVLTNAVGQSNALTMDKKTIAPALLAPVQFRTQGRQWVVAQFPDQTFVGKSGLISGLNFRPAKPGDTIVIYGIGFGAVTPATPAGVIAPGSTALQTQPSFRFGQTPAALAYSGMTPGLVGLYQFNVVVPNVASGDVPLNVDVSGVAVNQALFITVGP